MFLLQNNGFFKLLNCFSTKCLLNKLKHITIQSKILEKELLIH